MKKRIGFIVTIVIIVLVFCLLAWRFWPRSFSNLISVDENSIKDFSAYSMVHRFENGQTYTDTYRIDNTAQQTATPEEIIAILATSGYRQDLRNLLPWALDQVGSDQNYDGKTVTVSFYTGIENEEYAQIQFLSSSIIAVSGESFSGFRIYHPTNHETIDKLVEYLQTHGIKQELLE